MMIDLEKIGIVLAAILIDKFVAGLIKKMVVDTIDRTVLVGLIDKMMPDLLVDKMTGLVDMIDRLKIQVDLTFLLIFSMIQECLAES
jgi:hypothetical protein